MRGGEEQNKTGKKRCDAFIQANTSLPLQIGSVWSNNIYTLKYVE